METGKTRECVRTGDVVKAHKDEKAVAVELLGVEVCDQSSGACIKPVGQRRSVAFQRALGSSIRDGPNTSPGDVQSGGDGLLGPALAPKCRKKAVDDVVHAVCVLG